MAFVLDASIALGWVVGRQASAYSGRIRLRARREPYHAATGPLRAALPRAGVKLA